MKRAEELAREIRRMDIWDMDMLAELCDLADMSEEWAKADGDTFEEVIYKAAEKLGVEVINQRLKERFLKAGYPESEMDHYNSDLYVYVTELTTRIISEWCEDHGYRMEFMCPIFKDQITGKRMYDCAFQWHE